MAGSTTSGAYSGTTHPTQQHGHSRHPAARSTGGSVSVQRSTASSAPSPASFTAFGGEQPFQARSVGAASQRSSSRGDITAPTYSDEYKQATSQHSSQHYITSAAAYSRLTSQRTTSEPEGEHDLISFSPYVQPPQPSESSVWISHVADPSQEQRASQSESSVWISHVADPSQEQGASQSESSVWISHAGDSEYVDPRQMALPLSSEYLPRPYGINMTQGGSTSRASHHDHISFPEGPVIYPQRGAEQALQSDAGSSFISGDHIPDHMRPAGGSLYHEGTPYHPSYVHYAPYPNEGYLGAPALAVTQDGTYSLLGSTGISSASPYSLSSFPNINLRGNAASEITQSTSQTQTSIGASSTDQSEAYYLWENGPRSQENTPGERQDEPSATHITRELTSPEPKKRIPKIQFGDQDDISLTEGSSLISTGEEDDDPYERQASRRMEDNRDNGQSQETINNTLENTRFMEVFKLDANRGYMIGDKTAPINDVFHNEVSEVRFDYDESAPAEVGQGKPLPSRDAKPARSILKKS